MTLRWLGGGVVAGVLLAGQPPWTWMLLALVFAVLRGGVEALGGLGLGLLAVLCLPQGPLLEGPVSLRGRAIGAPSGGRVDIELAGGGRVRVHVGSERPSPGEPLWVAGIASPLRHQTLPGRPNPAWGARRAGIQTVVRRTRIARLEPPPAAPDLPGKHGGVLTALASGRRQAVPPETLELMRRTGTAHLLAISGFHVGLVGVLFGGFVGFFTRLSAIWRPSGVGPGWALAGSVVGGLAYAWLAGFPVSAQRACGVLLLAAFARSTGREVDGLGALLCCAAAVLIVDPAALDSPGFQLSFSAVLGLVRLAPALSRLLPPDLPPGLGWLVRALIASLSATVGTLPVSALWFQAVSVSSPVANLVAMPVVGTLVAPGALIGAAAPQWACGPPLWVADRSFDLLLGVLASMDADPWTLALTPLTAGIACLATVWPRRPLLALSLAWLGLSMSSEQDAATVTFLDIGQGDAALVSQPDGQRWLIDGGPPGPALKTWLLSQKIHRLDVVAVSHGHADHTGGLLPVLRDLEVQELWVPSGGEGLDALTELAKARGVWVREDPPGTWTCPGGRINDRSLVLLAGGVLFSGDLEAEGERCLASSLPRAPVLKVPHHGSAGSSTRALLDAVQPQLAVVSAGLGNTFDHPRDEALARLQQAGARVARTDAHGTIEVRVTEDAVRFRSFEGGWSQWTELPRPTPGLLARGPSPPAGAGGQRP